MSASRRTARTGGPAMSEKPSILVHCANGLQGRAIVAQLRGAGCPVRAMVRDVSRAAPLIRAGAEVVSADFDAPDALREAHRGMDAVLMQLPAGDEPASLRRRGEAALDAIAHENIPTVIFNAGARSPRTAAALPTFDAKRALEEYVRASGRRWAVIRPTFLLQNLLLPWIVRGVIEDGAIVYPVRADLELSWVAAEDVGRLTALILEREAFGENIDLGAARLSNGDELAKSFAGALGRPIRFASLPLGQFEQGVDAALGPGVGRRVSAIFRFIETHPDDLAFVATPYGVSPRLWGFAPMTIADWVRLNRDAFV